MEIEKIAGFGWRLIFAPGLIHNFFDLPHCIDLRKSLLGSNNFKKGQHIGGHFLDDEGMAIVLDVLEDTLVVPFCEIPSAIRNEWGLPVRKRTSTEEMMRTMRSYYANDPDFGKHTFASVNFLRFARTADKTLIRCEFPADLRAQTELMLRSTKERT